MEYENCAPGGGLSKSSNTLLYIGAVVLLLFLIYYFTQSKQHLVPVRGGPNIQYGIPVNHNLRHQGRRYIR
jgi:hypothetical protein